MITIVGSANMDLIARTPHLPAPGETVLATGLLEMPGGKGANQAVAAARAGSEVTFVGRVGEDEHGRELRANLEAAGVSPTQVTVDTDSPTGLALIVVDEAGENSIVVVPGANGLVSPGDVENARLTIVASRILVAQLEIPVDTVLAAARIAHEAGALVMLNPAPAVDVPPELLALVDVLVPNAEELARLSGVGAPVDPAATAGMLLQIGVKAVVVTLGPEGVLIVTPEQEIDIPAFVVDVVDTTGAGDAFVGNLAHALDVGQPLEAAARFAAAAAALSVQRRGAQPSMPSCAETEAFLRSHS